MGLALEATRDGNAIDLIETLLVDARRDDSSAVDVVVAGPQVGAHTLQSLADDMVERLRSVAPMSGADALRALRREFPESPLSARVAALATMRS